MGRRFLNIIKNCAHGWQPPLKNSNREDRHINVHNSGEFLSGPEQIRAESRRKELLDRHPLATGVEMEGEGERMSLKHAFILTINIVVFYGDSNWLGLSNAHDFTLLEMIIGAFSSLELP